MDKILIMGSRGMAGHKITEYLKSKNKYDIYVTFRKKKDYTLLQNEFDIDAFNTNEVIKVIENVKPKFVINCIGVLNKCAEENPDIAIYINSYFPHFLDKLSRLYNYKLIHITTDCVFSGKKGNYMEDDFRDADTWYGRSKALGEVNNNRTLTLRTSIIGPDINPNGIGLFNWFLNQNEEINGYCNVFWSGVTTLELAKAIETSFNQSITGIYNLTNNKKISKYELLLLFKKYTKKQININKYFEYYSDKSLLDTRNEFNYVVPSYEHMIREMVENMIEIESKTIK